MSYLIKVNEGKVKKVVVGDNDYLTSIVDDEAGEWIISPENYGIGYNYENGVFYPPKPYPSWKLDANFVWQAPKPKTSDVWIEDKQQWVSMADAEMYAKQKPYIDAVQETLDYKAMEYGYDNIISACSYAGFTNSFQAESQAFITWRASVWEYCYSQIPLEPTVEELTAGLPAYTGV